MVIVYNSEIGWIWNDNRVVENLLKHPCHPIELRAKNEDYDRNDNRNKKEANEPGSKQSPLFQDFDPYGNSAIPTKGRMPATW